MGMQVIRDVIVPTVAVGTLIWAVYAGNRSWKESLRIRKNEFVRNYTDDFYSAKELTQHFFDMDYQRFIFDEDDLGTTKETELCRLLDYLNTVAYAVNEGLVDQEDLKLTTVGYATRVVWENARVQWYLGHVKTSDPKTGATAFGHFRELGLRFYKADPTTSTPEIRATPDDVEPNP